MYLELQAPYILLEFSFEWSLYKSSLTFYLDLMQATQLLSGSVLDIPTGKAYILLHLAAHVPWLNIIRIQHCYIYNPPLEFSIVRNNLPLLLNNTGPLNRK